MGCNLRVHVSLLRCSTPPIQPKHTHTHMQIHCQDAESGALNEERWLV